MSGVCLIAAAGDFSPSLLPRARKSDCWIAADAGYRKLLKAGIKADLFVGDGDSSDRIPDDTERVVLPVIKDDTDTVAAVRIGLQRGYRTFCLFGALGGDRPSHSVANIQTLLMIRRNSGRPLIADERCLMTVLTPEEGDVSLPDGIAFFSLFATCGPVTLSVRNAKYSGEGICLTPDFPLGVSNERRPGSTVRVTEGTALLVCEPAAGSRFKDFSVADELMRILARVETDTIQP